MSSTRTLHISLAAVVVVLAATLTGWRAFAQATVQPTNDLPNPYRTVENYFKLPDGRAGGSTSAVEIDKDGRSIKSFGKLGAGPGEFRTPHGLAFDSRGRLFVADRGNVRVQIFDQDGRFLDDWKQFSRPSGIYIDKSDMLYSVDSESSDANHAGWKRGLRIGSARDGKVLYFVPDPEKNPTGTSAAEGVAIDARGNLYGAEVGPKAVKKYVKP